MRRNFFGAIGTVLTAALYTSSAQAFGLIEAYEAALQNDPIYRSATYENQAGQQYKALGRSNLLPSVGINYSTSKNRADVASTSLFGQNTTHPVYTSVVGALTLRQPVLNLDGLARYRQGVAQSAYSTAQFGARASDLVLRVTTAYFDALFAQDQLALATAQRDTYVEQLQVNKRLFEKGEGTRTDLLETQARLDLAAAQLVETQDNAAAAQLALTAITGQENSQLNMLAEGFRASALQPLAFDDWKAQALANNFDLEAQRYTVESAYQEIQKARAGYTPRVDFIASYNKNKSDTFQTFNQDATVRSIGVQLNLPIYSGGAVDAGVTQAVANHEKAKADLEMKTAQVLIDLRKQYNQVLSSAAKIDALIQSVDSAQLLVKATRQSVKGGVRINLDVLNAEQQLFSAQRDLAQARYGYLVAYLRLRAGTGMVGREDVQTVARYFPGY